MTSEQIRQSIDSGELKLDFWDKLTHFGIVILLLAIPLAVIFMQIINHQDDEPNNFRYLYLVIPIILGYFFYKLQKVRLKFKIIPRLLPNDDLRFLLEGLILEKNWSIRFVDKNVFVAKTSPGYFSGSRGEQITVLFDKENIYINSICDPQKRSSVVSAGRNRLNVKILIEKIEEAQSLTNCFHKGVQNFI